MKIEITSNGKTTVIEDVPEHLISEMAGVFDSASSIQLAKIKESTCVHEQYKQCSLAEKMLSVASMAYEELGV